MISELIKYDIYFLIFICDNNTIISLEVNLISNVNKISKVIW